MTRQARIYISGRVTGIPDSEAREKFADACEFLNSIGFDAVNPMESGLPSTATWEQHMVKDIELLFGCDAIYMMSDWVYSKGASIEYDIAKRLNMPMFFENDVQMIARVAGAIQEVTGLSLHDYSTRSRKRNVLYARMLFVHHCRKRGMTLSMIAGHIHRKHSSVLHMVTAYENDFAYNPKFKRIAVEVNERLELSGKENR